MIDDKCKSTDENDQERPCIVVTSYLGWSQCSHIPRETTRKHGFVHVLAQSIGSFQEVTHPGSHPVLFTPCRAITKCPALPCHMDIIDSMHKKDDIPVCHAQDQDEYPRDS